MKRETGEFMPICSSFASKSTLAFYLHDEFGLEISNTVYALDSTTIDLCLSVFWWGRSGSESRR